VFRHSKCVTGVESVEFEGARLALHFLAIDKNVLFDLSPFLLAEVDLVHIVERDVSNDCFNHWLPVLLCHVVLVDIHGDLFDTKRNLVTFCSHRSILVAPERYLSHFTLQLSDRDGLVSRVRGHVKNRFLVLDSVEL